MIDLDLMEFETIDFKLNGKVINMLYPTQKVLKQFQLMETIQDPNKQMETLLKIMVEMLNNNTNEIKFKVSDLEKLSLKTLNVLMQHVMESVQGLKKK